MRMKTRKGFSNMRVALGGGIMFAVIAAAANPQFHS